MQPSITSELLWGFAVGAASVSTLTVTADKLGSKIAGALGGVPSTVASSLFFLALARSPKHAAEATHVIPLAMGFYGLLLTLYCSTVRLGVVKALVIALSLWYAHYRLRSDAEGVLFAGRECLTNERPLGMRRLLNVLRQHGEL